MYQAPALLVEPIGGRNTLVRLGAVEGDAEQALKATKRLLLGRFYHDPIVVDQEKWTLPKGAFKTTAGPT